MYGGLDYLIMTRMASHRVLDTALSHMLYILVATAAAAAANLLLLAEIESRCTV